MAITPQQIDPQEPQVQEAPLDAGGEQTPVDLGDWNEQLTSELQDCLKKLAQHYCDEFRYPRRLEVMQAWRARSFWREMQHLTWNWESESWEVLGPAGVGPNSSPGADKNTAVLYSTNMYQGFGESFIAVITQAVPNLRFEPEDMTEAADIETARIGDNFRKYIQHENDPIALMTKAAYIAWTDGRIHGWTRWEMDKRTKQPREMQTIYGSMEVKVPVLKDKVEDYTYLQFSDEDHLSAVRAIVKSRDFEDPMYYKKIKGGSTGNGQDVYERTARISVKQGISLMSAGGDMYSHLCTVQRTWMRPSAFLEDCVDEKYRDELTSLFPTGAYCEFANGVYIGSKDSCMDNEWAVENIMEGDGSYRNAKGTCLVSVQERANDTINTTQDTFEKAQPASHWDQEMFDTDAFKEQVSAPGQKSPVDVASMQPGDNIGNHVFFEPAASVDQSQLAYLKELMTDIPSFLTGISEILFGETGGGGDSSGKALSIKQAAAMGRVGLPFRIMKRLYSRMMEQAVRCAAENRTSDINIGIPDEQGRTETIAVRVGDLSGNVRCYPDTDENYPESWTSKRQTYMTIMQDANADPTMKAIVASPQNQFLGKKLIGLQDFEIPDASSWEKQMMEINILLTTPPTPPGIAQVPNPLQPQTIETIPTPPKSTVPVDPDWDNHNAEIQTITIFLNSAKGQQLVKTNPDGIANVKLHGMEHKQVLAKQQMQQMQMQMMMNPPKQGPSSPKEPTPEGKEKSGEQNPAHHSPTAQPPAPASGL